MVLETLLGLMAISTTENGLMEKVMEDVQKYGKMEESTLELLKKIKCMEMERFIILMAKNLLANL